MTVDDMLNAVGLTAVLFYFMMPTIVVILTIYAYNRHRKKKEIQRDIKKANREKFEKGKQLLENSDDKEAISAIGELDTRPKEINKFTGLALSFDESGHVK